MTHPTVVLYDISKQLFLVKKQKQGIFQNKDVYWRMDSRRMGRLWSASAEAL